TPILLMSPPPARSRRRALASRARAPQVKLGSRTGARKSRRPVARTGARPPAREGALFRRRASVLPDALVDEPLVADRGLARLDSAELLLDRHHRFEVLLAQPVVADRPERDAGEAGQRVLGE